MLSFSVLVAGSFSLGSMIANDIAPSALNAARYLIATVLLGGYLQVFGPRIRREHLVAPWRYLLLGGIFAIYFVLMFEGLKTAPAVSTSAVFTLTPLMSAGFGFLLLSQVSGARILMALAIGGAGAVWVIFRADLAALRAFEIGRGEAIFFVGCIAHALFTPLLKRLNRGESALVSTALVMAGCFLTLLFFGLPEIIATDWRGLSPLMWVTLAYLALAASATTTFLLQYAALRLPSAKVMAYTYLTPSWVICWEFALGKGMPPALVLPGIGLTVAALLMLLKSEASEEPRIAPPRA